MLMINFQKHRKCGMQGKFSMDLNKAPKVILINTEYAGMAFHKNVTTTQPLK